MKKAVSYVLLIIMFILIPILSIGLIVYITPDCYESSYSRVLEVQYDYLKEVEGQKIVIVGTSSSAFGVLAQKIEEEFNIPVVQFGLYGIMGNTFILDISEKYINEGDIVVYMYDIYDNAMSIGFNPEVFLQASYKNIEMFSDLSKKDKSRVLAMLPSFISYNFELKKKGVVTDAGVLFGGYSKNAFNDHGTIKYVAEKNVMVDGYISGVVGDISDEIIDENFTNYIANWANTLEKKGATVLYHYGPIDNLTKTANTTEESIKNFMTAWEEGIGMKTINSMLDCYLDYRYFYNGNFHLNYAGAQYFTSYMINNLETALYGNSSYEIIHPDYPV